MVVDMGEHLDYDIWKEDQYKKYTSYIKKDVKSVLDVGCGRGEWLSLLKKKGFDTYGCDTDNRCINKSSNFGSVKKVDIMSLTDSYKTNQFDLVTAFHILEHVTSPLKGLEQIKKVSKKYVLTAVPNARYISQDERLTHIYSWNGDTFTNLIKKAGLKVVSIKQDRTNVFPNLVRSTPVLNRALLRMFIGPNELIVLCSKK